MIRPILIAAIAALAMPSAAAAQADPLDGSCAIGSGPTLRVNIIGLKDRTGRLKLELYPGNEADFLKDDREIKREGKQMRRVWSATPAAGPVTLCIRAPSAGQWALLFTHDRDGKNKFNFWQDGAGFPSNQRLGRSRPKVRQALVNIPAAGGQITVRAQYLKGLGGFGPND
ncbi:DUF2141 domain-containing protein [Sphingomonas sp. M1-B02]|uniref:DUF2141 domain-containing protein n=1 Tax=Sphingomonas sp. M1-B02 TaxID=3114300 RepID=UPI00223EC14D|nr:DUF2141 domain-containing protein [Sphingomonas sp. S6-11]UZK64902.1 DUF2141 domain-containing protein [Sphingomonas sp. S6-11]